MKEAIAGYDLVRERVFTVYFLNESAQVFTLREGDIMAVFPIDTEGTPAYIEIVHRDSGTVETIYMHHVAYTRLSTAIRKRAASVPDGGTPEPHTSEQRDTLSDA